MDKKYYSLLFVALISLCMMVILYRIGCSQTDDRWEQWCIQNDYAQYDTKTGEIVLFDKKYRDNFLKENFPELFDKVFNKNRTFSGNN